MSDRHMHITSYLHDRDSVLLARFEAEARKHFEIVQPVYYGSHVIAYALYSKDSGYNDLIYTLPEAAVALSGILTRDIEFVSAGRTSARARSGCAPVSAVPESSRL